MQPYINGAAYLWVRTLHLYINGLMGWCSLISINKTWSCLLLYAKLLKVRIGVRAFYFALNVGLLTTIISYKMHFTNASIYFTINSISLNRINKPFFCAVNLFVKFVSYLLH